MPSCGCRLSSVEANLVGGDEGVAVEVEGVAIETASRATKLRSASHQMYQTMPKPRLNARAERITPVPVFFGMWIGRKPSAGPLVAAGFHVVPGVKIVHDG